jgi:hypothetical protein
MALVSCGDQLTGNHLKLIKEGHQPNVAMVISIPNHIFVTYKGEKAFENRLINYPSSTDFKDVINEKAIEVLKQDSLVKLYIPQDKASEDLLDSLTYERTYYWKGGAFSRNDKRLISEWGKYRNLDFIGFVMPNVTDSPSNGSRIISGKGLKAEAMGRHSRSVDYVVVLFDVTNLNISGKASHLITRTNNPPFRKKLSDEDIARIKSERIDKMEQNDQYGVVHPSYEKRVEAASYYSGDDYTALKKEQIEQLDVFFMPLVRENIHEILKGLGLARRDRGTIRK